MKGFLEGTSMSAHLQDCIAGALSSSRRAIMRSAANNRLNQMAAIW